IVFATVAMNYSAEDEEIADCGALVGNATIGVSRGSLVSGIRNPKRRYTTVSPGVGTGTGGRSRDVSGSVAIANVAVLAIAWGVALKSDALPVCWLNNANRDHPPAYVQLTDRPSTRTLRSLPGRGTSGESFAYRSVAFTVSP